MTSKRQLQVRERILNLFKEKQRYFSKMQHLELINAADDRHISRFDGKLLSEADIKKTLHLNDKDRSLVRYHVDELVKSNELLCFRFFNKKLYNYEFSLLQEKKDKNPHIKLPKTSVMYALPSSDLFFGQSFLFSKLGGQIVGREKILNNFSFSQEIPNLKNSEFRLHFEYGCQLYHLTISNDVWVDLQGKPLTVFISSSHNFKKIENETFKPNQKMLNYFGEGSVLVQLPILGVISNYKKFNIFGQSTQYPLLGTIALTIYPNGEKTILTCYSNDEVSTCNLANDLDSHTRLISIESWLVEGTRWPGALSQNTSSNIPALWELKPCQHEQSIGQFFNKALKPKHFSETCWIDLNNLINSESYRSKLAFEESILCKSWLLSSNAIINLKESYLAISYKLKT